MMGTLTLIALLALTLWAVRWVKNADQPKRGRRVSIDPQTGQVTVTDRRHPVLAALLAAAVGYGVARWRDRRDLADRAETSPLVRCARCRREVTADPVGGWLDSRGRWQCVGRVPHEPTTSAVGPGKGPRRALPF